MLPYSLYKHVSSRKLNALKMTKKSKKYLFLTAVGVTLVFFGAWGCSLGGKLNIILGAILFLIGFLIMLHLYGWKWIEWW